MDYLETCFIVKLSMDSAFALILILNIGLCISVMTESY